MPPILHLSIPVRDLDEARAFYVDVLGCAPGRVRDGWIDVWFYGMQVTLHEEPERILSPAERGCRHFGVTLDAAELDSVLQRLATRDVTWVVRPSTQYAGTDREQTKALIADPSGNAIELKTYTDRAAAFAD